MSYPGAETGLASQICELLARYVAQAAPRGVKEWGSYAFDLVANFEVEFLIALVGWESDPSDENTLRLRAALVDVIDAWEDVTHYYDSHDFRLLGMPQ